MQWLKLAPGIDSIPCENGLLLKSDFVALRLEGASATMVAERIIPFLSEWRSTQNLCEQVSDYAPEAIRALAGQLVSQGVLIARDSKPSDALANSPWLGMLEALGVPLDAAVARLQTLRVGIFGLEAIGAGIAVHLAQMGVGSFILIDPGLLTSADTATLPFPVGEHLGAPRQTAMADLLKSILGKVPVVEFEKEVLEKGDIKDIIGKVDFAFGVFDRAFSAAHQWLNSACLELGVPALYCELQATRAYVGPTVFPGETACYMCWRMRHIATRDNFSEAMNYELAMDKAKDLQSHHRPVFPPLAAWAASLASIEMIKVTLGLTAPQTANHVLELNALDATIVDHIFLHRPDCPSCRGKLKAVVKDDAHGIDA